MSALLNDSTSKAAGATFEDMGRIRLTSKRQATFPVAVCRELGLQPGDEIEVESRVVDGVRVWVLSPVLPPLEWVAPLRKYGRGKSHDWRKIKATMERRGWDDDDRS